MSLLSGHTAVPLVGEELARQMKDWHGYPDGLVRLHPGGWLFPSGFTHFADKCYRFKFRASDVVVNTYAKCGTTWMQELVWTMRNNPNLDHPEAHTPGMARSPFLDFDMFLHANTQGKESLINPISQRFESACPGRSPADGMTVQLAEVLPDPRTIKTHLPLSLLTPDLLDTAKVVYVARNPKDVLVSFHHHCRIGTVMNYKGTFEEYVQYFVDDNIVYSPYWLHLKEAWEKRHHPNLHFVFYEDLKSDILAELTKLNTFLATDLSEQQLKNVAHYCSFGQMKARNTINIMKNPSPFNMDIVKKEGGFFRKGETGDWKGRLTPVMEAKVDKWVADKMTTFGINFKYSL